jgi:hypothetical protein
VWRSPAFSAGCQHRWSVEGALTLLSRKPIANRHTQPFGTLHATNPCRQIGAKEPAIRCLVRQPPHCRETQVDAEQYHSMNSLIA